MMNWIFLGILEVGIYSAGYLRRYKFNLNVKKKPCLISLSVFRNNLYRKSQSFQQARERLINLIYTPIRKRRRKPTTKKGKISLV